MKKQNLFRIATCLVLALCSKSYASDQPKYEIWANSLGGLNIGITGSSTTFYLLSSSAPAVTGGFFFANNFEGMLSFSVSATSGSTTITFLPGLNYSLGGPIESAYFVEGELGISSTSAGFWGSTSSFVWGGGVGKRFKLLGHITYAPSATIFMGTSPVSVTLNITPVQFSVLF